VKKFLMKNVSWKKTINGCSRRKCCKYLGKKELQCEFIAPEECKEKN